MPAPPPRSVDYTGSELLRITWSDGRETVFQQTALRRACPCAVCRRQREELGPDRFIPPSILEKVHVQRTAPVGRYGIKIFWSDGHDAGIYTFQMLRDWADAVIPTEGRSPGSGSGRSRDAG
ncbi:DUF971 domain-containing protein [bacterium]|nr:DUF971 domain-containing protein [bacterium]